MDNTERLNTARAIATRVFGSEVDADRWLGEPRFMYWDMAPVDLLSMPEGLERVLETLAQIEADPSSHAMDFSFRTQSRPAE